MLGCLKALGAINAVVPKKPTRVLFYESQMGAPKDNTEALCNWIVDHDAEHKLELLYCAGCIPDQKLSSACKRVGVLGGLLGFLRAKYVFYSFGGMRIDPSKHQKVICLWHGIPLKSIGKMADARCSSEDIDDFTEVLATSDLLVPVMARAFGCTEDKVMVAGQPRNDYLAQPVSYKRAIGDGIGEVDKAILWMPTFRRSSDGRFGEGFSGISAYPPLLADSRDLEQLNDLLADRHIVLIVKAHSYDSLELDSMSHIRFVTDRDLAEAGIKLYQLIASFDALITDYSSVAFDFMLLDRPIAYTIDDFDEYERCRGFSFDDPLSLMPGRKMIDKQDLFDFCISVADGVDDHKDERNRVLEMMYEYRTGSSCERIAEHVGLEL